MYGLSVSCKHPHPCGSLVGHHVHQHRLRETVTSPSILWQVAKALVDGHNRWSMLTDVKDRFKMEQVTAVHVFFFYLCSVQELYKFKDVCTLSQERVCVWVRDEGRPR